MAWTEKMVEDLKIMWKQGLTTGEIGKRLGVSNNSIVGKVHRLQLDARPSPIKKKDEEQENAAVAATAETKPAAAIRMMKTFTFAAKKSASDRLTAKNTQLWPTSNPIKNKHSKLPASNRGVF